MSKWTQTPAERARPEKKLFDDLLREIASMSETDIDAFLQDQNSHPCGHGRDKPLNDACSQRLIELQERK